jgi:hypothetical protein
MCQVTFGDLPLAASLQTISIMRSTIISDFTPANDTGGIFRSGFVVCRLPFSIQKTAVRFQRDCVAKLFGCRLQDLVLSFGRLVGRARRCGVY